MPAVAILAAGAGGTWFVGGVKASLLGGWPWLLRYLYRGCVCSSHHCSKACAGPTASACVLRVHTKGAVCAHIKQLGAAPACTPHNVLALSGDRKRQKACVLPLMLAGIANLVSFCELFLGGAHSACIVVWSGLYCICTFACQARRCDGEIECPWRQLARASFVAERVRRHSAAGMCTAAGITVIAIPFRGAAPHSCCCSCHGPISVWCNGQAAQYPVDQVCQRA